MNTNTLSAKPPIALSLATAINHQFFPVFANYLRQPNARPLLVPANCLQQMHQIIALIGANHFAKLPFATQNFEACLYLAFHQNYITHDEMLTAKMLYDSKQWLGMDTAITYYAFADVNGPYQLLDKYNFLTPHQYAKLVLHATGNMRHFGYYILDLPTPISTSFIAAVLKMPNKLFIPPYLPIAIQRLYQQIITENPIASQYNITLPSDIGDPYFRCQFLNFLQRYTLDKRWQQYAVTIFLAALVSADENMPLLCLSPNYDLSDPDKPILSLIIPSITAIKNLLTIAFEDPCLPQAIYGNFDPRFIRAHQEAVYMSKITRTASAITALYPETHDLTFSVRPVAITQGPIQITYTHGYPSNSILDMLHDMFHVFSTSRHFPVVYLLLRELINLQPHLLDASKFLMSKALWKLTDLASNLATTEFHYKLLCCFNQIKQLAKCKPIGDVDITHPFIAYNRVRLLYFIILLQKAGVLPNSKKSYNKDSQLFFFFNLIINPTIWIKTLQMVTLPGHNNYAGFYDTNNFILNCWLNPDFKNSLTTEALKEKHAMVIADTLIFPDLNKFLALVCYFYQYSVTLKTQLARPVSFIMMILLYYTNSADRKNLMPLLELVKPSTLFYWSKNSGIYFHSQCRPELKKQLPDVQYKLADNPKPLATQAMFLAIYRLLFSNHITTAQKLAIIKHTNDMQIPSQSPTSYLGTSSPKQLYERLVQLSCLNDNNEQTHYTLRCLLLQFYGQSRLTSRSPTFMNGHRI